MQTRPTAWFDTTAREERFGIKVNHPLHGWINAGDGDGIFMFDNKEDRETKRAELRNTALKIEGQS